MRCPLYNSNKFQVVRDENSPYYVSEREYTNSRYQPFCAGGAYLITGDLVPKLYKASFGVPIFPLEDVYITGILAKEIGAKRWNLRQLWSVEVPISFKFARQIMVNGFVIFLQTDDNMPYRQKWAIWKAVLFKQTREHVL